ncbi:MAG TPA: LysR family transcriptional regulator [Symbiobacteriaceae bacterium]|nr:LysR family transcriptional regulator [Symbiobacteriaceae bacterium]
MNLHHLKVFHAVAHAGNFSQAAQRLFLSQPAVSVQVRRLEQALGVPLVEVYGRQVHLTQAGVRLKDYADHILRMEKDAEEAMAEFQDPARGSVRVGASTTPGTYLLPGLIAAFRHLHPGIQVTLAIGNTRAITGKLLANDLDMGIVGEETPAENRLVLEPWMTDQMAIIAPPDHRLAQAPTVSAEEVLAEPLILREPGSSTREVFVAHARARGLEVVPALELSNTEAVKQAVAAGLGLAVVSLLTIQTEILAGRLQVLRVPDLRLERQLFLARHTGKRLSVGGKAWSGFLRSARAGANAGHA